MIESCAKELNRFVFGIENPKFADIDSTLYWETTNQKIVIYNTASIVAIVAMLYGIAEPREFPSSLVKTGISVFICATIQKSIDLITPTEGLSGLVTRTANVFCSKRILPTPYLTFGKVVILYSLLPSELFAQSQRR